MRPGAALDRLKSALGSTLPSVSEISRQSNDPFRVLVSTMISLRTKDDVTRAASARLFAAAPDATTLSRLSLERIRRLIYPCGFYRTKAAAIGTVARIVAAREASGLDGVPRTRDELIALPGVGPKTANLTLGLGYGIPAICVDTHVHRIANRLGWVDTKRPEDTEPALERLLPRGRWIEINEVFVAFGQTVCTPTSPRCSRCPLAARCPRIGVSRSR